MSAAYSYDHRWRVVDAVERGSGRRCGCGADQVLLVPSEPDCQDRGIAALVIRPDDLTVDHSASPVTEITDATGEPS